MGSESVLSLLPSSDDDLDEELSSDEVSVGELSADELTGESQFPPSGEVVLAAANYRPTGLSCMRGAAFGKVSKLP
eukprot:COSAG05_NODE_9066_length_649_cov_2.425455_1_plen_76_part_00